MGPPYFSNVRALGSTLCAHSDFANSDAVSFDEGISNKSDSEGLPILRWQARTHQKQRSAGSAGVRDFARSAGGVVVERHVLPFRLVALRAEGRIGFALKLDQLVSDDDHCPLAVSSSVVAVRRDRKLWPYRPGIAPTSPGCSSYSYIADTQMLPHAHATRPGPRSSPHAASAQHPRHVVDVFGPKTADEAKNEEVGLVSMGHYAT